ncbi:MAG: hypothetical protein E6Q97_30665 [Desulfurellales bacterium]|nr:MAG: hypothetical protein E6Q97_30665 [Desulfurellales bacterium]
MTKQIEVEIPKEAKGLRELVRAVDKKDPAPGAVSELRNYFLVNPNVCDAIGNLSTMTTMSVIMRSFPATSTRTAIDARLDLMRTDLGYESANALERSLIQHVVLCWLRLHDCELRYHMAMGDNPTLAQGGYWEKKLSANQARYLRAVETLARVRRLNVKIQVNVANQQIVAG